jgi:hypothetical protein
MTKSGIKQWVPMPETGQITNDQLQTIITQVGQTISTGNSIGNLDGGEPSSNYGGQMNIDSGGV